MSLCAWMLVNITVDSPVSSRTLSVSHWTERLQTWGLVGPGTNNWRRPTSEPVIGLTVSKRHQWRDLPCVRLQPPSSQRGRTAANHQRWSGFHKCPLCLGGCRKGTSVLVLVHMAGWVYCMHGRVCVPVRNTCPALLLTGPVNTEPSLPRTNWAGAGRIPPCPEAPSDSATTSGLVLQSPQLATLANFL